MKRRVTYVTRLYQAPSQRLLQLPRRTSIASLTLLTPSTSRANCRARVRASSESTKPLSCTVPLNVSTLIWCAFVTGSATRAAFTLAVTTPSSTACPADCCVGVLEQPATAVEPIRTANKRAAVFKRFICLLSSDVPPLSPCRRGAARQRASLHRDRG